jgi:hypothetical protein
MPCCNFLFEDKKNQEWIFTLRGCKFAFDSIENLKLTIEN